MKMHSGLMRSVLEYAEKHADGGESRCFPVVPCYDEREINYHIQLCEEAGFLVAEECGGLFSIVQLTYEGQVLVRGWRGESSWKDMPLK